MNETISGAKTMTERKKIFFILSFIENKRQNIFQIGIVGD